MDQDTRDLIRQLCTRAGMIMEDASMLAVTLPAKDDPAMIKAVQQLANNAADIASLIDASAALIGRPLDQS